VKPLLHNAVIQEIGQGQKAHPLMVGHPAPYQLMTILPEFAPYRGEVCGFVEAMAPEPSHVSHSA
jgi:hypothetical protein